MVPKNRWAMRTRGRGSLFTKEVRVDLGIDDSLPAVIGPRRGYEFQQRRNGHDRTTITNKHGEESPARPPKEAIEALTQAVKTSLERADKAGATIQGTEDRTRKQMEQAGP